MGEHVGSNKLTNLMMMIIISMLGFFGIKFYDLLEMALITGSSNTIGVKVLGVKYDGLIIRVDSIEAKTERDSNEFKKYIIDRK